MPLYLAARMLATLIFFFGFTFLSSGLAYSSQKVPVYGSSEQIPTYVFSQLESRLNRETRQNAEFQEPKGTLVYYYDYYLITNGPDSASLTTDTTFRRDRNGVLYATDMGSGVTSKFPKGATIQRQENVGEIFVRPGESPNAVLRGLLSIGGARFGKILTNSAISHPAIP